jgi:hypothetical protein
MSQETLVLNPEQVLSEARSQQSHGIPTAAWSSSDKSYKIIYRVRLEDTEVGDVG